MESLTVPFLPNQGAATNAVSDVFFDAEAEKGGHQPPELFAALFAEQLGMMKGKDAGADRLLEEVAVAAESSHAGNEEAVVIPTASDPVTLAAQLGLPMQPVAVTLSAQEGMVEQPIQVDARMSAPESQMMTHTALSSPQPKVMPLIPVIPDTGSGTRPMDDVIQRQVAAMPTAEFAGKLPVVPREAVATLMPQQVEQSGEGNGPGAFASSSSPVPIMSFSAHVRPVTADTVLPQQVIPQPVTSPVWSSMLGDRVVWMVGRQQQFAEIHLNPPALGPLEIRLSVQDGQASLTFTTQHIPVREALEAATPRLREMLGESGISLGSVAVNVGTFDQQAASDQSSYQDRRSTHVVQAEAAALAHFETRLPTTPMGASSSRGLIDLFI